MSRSRLYAANTDTTKPYKKGLWPRRKTVIPGSRAVGGVQGCCNGVNCCQFDVEEIDETPLPSGLKQGKKKVEKCKKASQTDVRKAKVKLFSNSNFFKASIRALPINKFILPYLEILEHNFLH